jgi:spore germination cell wall hydrolase CwlJ-like protein
MCLLVGVLLMGMTNVTAYAAEETKVVEKTETKPSYTKSELRLLSALIYCEAQSESYEGKLAVGIVVMNRKRSDLFPNSVKGVIYQKYQFGPVRSGKLDKALAEYDNGKFTSAAEKECIKAAKKALSGTKKISIDGKKVNFGKFLYFSGKIKGYTYQLENHQFK